MERKIGIRVSLLYHPVNVLGPGDRVGLWMQGCNLQCEGCVSPHTHDPTGGTFWTVRALARRILNYRCERLTITGGEPFLQGSALKSLLEILRNSGIRDVLVYSGQMLQDLERVHAWIRELVDVLIDGPFIKGQDTDCIWKGSENQTLHVLTEDPDLIAVYQAYLHVCKDGRIQYVRTSSSFHLIGIPYQTQWESIRHGLRQGLSDLCHDQ